jgi:hypothetical protein
LIAKFTLTGPSENLKQYWATAFIPTDRGLAAAARFASGRIREQLAFFHLPWWVVAGLILAGIATLWRRRMRTVAVAGPILFVLLIFAAVTKRFPFMDLRTSLFAMTILGLYAGLGVAAIVLKMSRHKATLGIAVVALIVLALPLGDAVATAMRPTVPYENMRGEIAYVLAHRGPRDWIAVNYAGSFGFSYYWPDRAAFRRETLPEPTNTFAVRYPPEDRIVIASYRRDQDIHAALAAALHRVHPPDHVWILLSHDFATQWTKAFPSGVGVERIAIPSPGRFDAVFRLTPRTEPA